MAKSSSLQRDSRSDKEIVVISWNLAGTIFALSFRKKFYFVVIYLSWFDRKRICDPTKRKEAQMPILKQLKEMLEDARIPYDIYNHALAYTAQEIAQRQHVRGQEMAKVVIVRADDKYVMAVLPASRMLSLPRVKAAVNAKEISLATEDEFASLFPGCEIGAMPPFGNLFGLPVYVDPVLEKDETIFFNAGNHVQTVKLRYQDFKVLVRPVVVPLTEERRKKAA